MYPVDRRVGWHVRIETPPQRYLLQGFGDLGVQVQEVSYRVGLLGAHRVLAQQSCRGPYLGATHLLGYGLEGESLLLFGFEDLFGCLFADHFAPLLNSVRVGLCRGHLGTTDYIVSSLSNWLKSLRQGGGVPLFTNLREGLFSANQLPARTPLAPTGRFSDTSPLARLLGPRPHGAWRRDDPWQA